MPQCTCSGSGPALKTFSLGIIVLPDRPYIYSQPLRFWPLIDSRIINAEPRSALDSVLSENATAQDKGYITNHHEN